MCYAGHIDYVRGCVYMASQFVGAMLGALLQGWLSPFSKVGEVDTSCHAPISALEDSNGCVMLHAQTRTNAQPGPGLGLSLDGS